MPLDPSIIGQLNTQQQNPDLLRNYALISGLKANQQAQQFAAEDQAMQRQVHKARLSDAERQQRDRQIYADAWNDVQGDPDKLAVAAAKRGASGDLIHKLESENVDRKSKLGPLKAAELKAEEERVNRFLGMVSQAEAMPDEQYLSAYPQIRKEAMALNPNLQLSEQPVPKSDLGFFRMGLESDAKQIARESERRAKAKEARDIEEFESTLPGKKADSQSKVAAAAGNAPIQPAERARLDMDQKQFELAQKKYLLDVRKVGEDKELSKILTPVEAATLGVPYGTTRAQAAGKMPSTAAQQTVAGYASRIANSNKSFDRLWQETGGLEATWNKLTPTMVNSSMGQEFDQIQRDFINATLRRESGAVISDSEFANARAQYLPQIGDSKDVLKRKAENRAIVQQSFIRAAGNAYQDPESLLREAGMGQPSDSATPATPASAAPVRPPTPKIGEIRKGHAFLGGDPALPASWKKVR